MNRNIAIDTGKHMTKAALRRTDGTDKLLEFRTKVDRRELGGSMMINSAESHSVKLNGVRYVVGEAAYNNDVKETTKASEIHKVAAYTAIAMLADSGDTVNCVIGCPLSIYSSRERVLAYQQYMFPVNHQMEIDVDGNAKVITIGSSMVMPESAGVILLNPEKYGSEVCGVIDIGGLNCNAAMYRNTYPVLRSMFTNNYGGNDLNISIRKKLQAALDIDLMDEILEQDILRGYDLADKETSSRIISECKASQVEKILNECMSHGWNLRSMPVIFTGGTSYLLRDEIARQLPTINPNDIASDVRFANVRGFLSVLNVT